MAKDRVSALMDGELDDRAAGHAIEDVKQDAEAAQTWRTYHVIRDAMGRTPPLSEGFAARMSERLGAEPTVLAPKRRLLDAYQPRRWLPVAAAATGAVALVGWLAFTPQPQVAPPPRMAQAPKPAALEQLAQKKQPATPIPVSANDYLLAHQGFSPRVSLQGMAPYVRTVSSER